MSSSRVFKTDPAFTPTPLVQRVLAPAEAAAPPRPPAETAPAGPAVITPVPTAAEPAPPVDLEAVRAEAYNQARADLAAQWETEFQQVMAAFADACQKTDSPRRTLV